MATTTTNDLARATVACYRSEFPGEGPDWDSDWWVEAWRIDTDNQADAPEFSTYLDACKAAWPDGATAATTTYNVTFTVREDLDRATYGMLAATSTATLAEACELCSDYGVKAKLTDDDGWVKGWVDSDGNYRLQ